MGPAHLDIVIVNWNTGEALRACIASIAAARSPALHIDRIVVVDNASTDGSAQGLDSADATLHVIRNERNLGFGAACNQGAAGSVADYLLFLNPDTRLFADSLARPLDYMSDPVNADVGICGVRLVDETGAAVTSSARFPTLRIFLGEMTGLSRVWPETFPSHLLTADECARSRDVDQVIGAYFLMRAPLFFELDGFDERFFVYLEEVDLALRARQRGQRSRYLADVTAYHRGGLSSDQVRATRLFYSLRSRMLYAQKHFPRWQVWGLLFATLAVEGPARLMERLGRGRLVEAREVLAAYRRFWTFLTAGGLTGRTTGWSGRNRIGGGASGGPTAGRAPRQDHGLLAKAVMEWGQRLFDHLKQQRRYP